MGEGQALHNSTWILAAAMLLAGTTLHAQPVEPASTSQVRILATGGTIAGKGNAAGTSYRSGAVSVDDLIAALPGVDKIARVTGEQIANVPSSDMDETIWRKLHARALAAFADPDVAGVVVTHGTDTLEETASPCASRHRPGMAWISWLVPVVAVPNIACSLLGFASVVAMVDAGAPYP
jgi:L-asparaginase